MVRPEIRSVDCSDHHPIEQWVPDHRDVYYWLNVRIGPTGEAAADNFVTLVATPAGLASLKQSGFRIGPEPPIVVEPYEWSSVRSQLEARVAECGDASWDRVNERLRRAFQWEYEGAP